MRRARNRGGVFFVDFPVLLLSVFLALWLLTTAPTKKPPFVPTFGQYAITIQWAGTSQDDVDLYVRDPNTKIAYFAAQQIDQMHLEHDDLGGAKSAYDSNGHKLNFERVVIRGVIAGEYVVNVHMYAKNDLLLPTPVKIQLWSLRGSDRMLLAGTEVLTTTGEQKTAFRFSLDAAGNVTQVNHLPADIVGQTVGGGQGGYATSSPPSSSRRLGP